MINERLLTGLIKNYVQLGEKELEALFERFEVASYDKNMRVTDIGQVENHVHFVVRGLLRKYFYSGKMEVVTELAKESDLISSFDSFIKEKPSGVIIETIEQSTLYSLNKENLERLCSQYPGLQKLYIALMNEAFLRADSRNQEKLIYSAKDLFRRFMEANQELVRRVPQKHLASYLDLRPETFSRLKHLLMQKRSPQTQA